MATVVRLSELGPMIAALRADGFRVIGPTTRDGAIVLAEIESADALPVGWGVALEPGGYRLRARDDRAVFGHAAGPQSWKTYLHPPRTPLWSARRDGAGSWSPTDAEEEAPRYAFLGVRACDLRAMGVQDRVLGRGGHPDRGYRARRDATMVISVHCTEPGATCFCVSTGGGPRAEGGFDVALTELTGADGGFLAEAGSPAGEALIASIPYEPADPSVVAAGDAAITAAADHMGRTLPEADLRDLLAGARDATHWDQVAQRCLTCGNCTMVCPTCFCTTVEDTTDLTGDVAERWLRWDSCFDLDFSYLHGGPVRASGRSRYRQWLTHKLGTWHDQFGESGCVGCGRCIVWCPVGIDITEEAHALAAEVAAGAEEGSPS
jgi:ferredoxin